jgi:hypothetical protein
MDVSRLWALFAFVALGLICLVLGFWLRAVYAPEWLGQDTTQKPAVLRPWMVEADCYSQLARDQRILNGQGLVQNHFEVENWPEGLIPSTTSPFDYVILILYAPLWFITKYPLDWAGALVSPALWIALVLFWMFFRSREFNLTGRALFLIGSAALPAFIWATACGRPRHQSLILALMAMGLTAEYERWYVELTPKRAWNIFAGVVWGMACWTSLFEPTVVVGSLILYNLIVRRRESAAFLISFGTVMLAALLIEGVHVFIPGTLTPDYRQYLVNWLLTIAEVQGVSFGSYMQEMTLVAITLPFVAWRLLAREGERVTDTFVILLTLLLCILTFVQRRWIYYASLGELFLIVRYCQDALDPGMRMMNMLRVGFTTKHWPPTYNIFRISLSCVGQALVLLMFFVGLADADKTQIEMHARVPANQPSPQLAQLARSIDAPGGIMAPWWLSPGLLYFSGQPIVSGSSHCGITGIVASAQFYTTTSWADAEAILKKRQVRWVVVYDDQIYEYPLLNSSRGILGQPYASDDNKGDADSTVAQILISDQDLPTSLHLRGVTDSLKLYEYVPDSASK